MRQATWRIAYQLFNGIVAMALSRSGKLKLCTQRDTWATCKFVELGYMHTAELRKALPASTFSRLWWNFDGLVLLVFAISQQDPLCSTR
jgi:hypothetical protein